MDPSDTADRPDGAPGEVTRLLRALGEGSGGGSGAAEAQLYEVVYAELRRLAGRYVGPDDTLQPTALVNEAFVRLAQSDAVEGGRGHFFGVAAKAMRRIAVDEFRRRNAVKRGRRAEEAPPPEEHAGTAPLARELDQLALDDALKTLEELSPDQVRVAELRIYAGLPVAECAEALETSTATVERRWRAAQAFLKSRLAAGDS